MSLRRLSSLALAGATATGGMAPEARSCSRLPEAIRALDLTRSDDRSHLARDAQGAETIAIHYADVSPARRVGSAEYGRVRDSCMTALFGEIAQAHTVDTGTVRAYTSVRNPGFDALVLLGFALLYAGAAFLVTGVVLRRRAERSQLEILVSLFGASLVTALIALLIFDLWVTTAESFRLGSWHLSYRVARLPVLHHHLEIFAGAVGISWLIGLWRR